MCEPWSDRVWDTLSYRKHLRATKKAWERSIARAMTTGRGGVAQYDPNLTPDEIREIELATIAPENMITETHHLRTYFRQVGRTIGASNGEFTDFVFVIWQISNSVHGFPISKDELISKKRVGRHRLEGE